MSGPTEEESDLTSALHEAARLAEAGEEESALRMLLELEQQDPEDVRVLCMIGVVADQLGAEGMASDFYRRCLAQEPTDPTILVPAGAGLAAMGDPAAEPALRLAALTAPGMAAARMHYGSLLVRNGLVEQGLDELRAASGLDPEDALVRRELGVGYLLAGRDGDALAELESAVTLDSGETEARVLLGLVLLQRGEVARAAEEMYPAAAECVDEGNLQLVLSLTFALEGWMDEAWLALSRAETAADPPDPQLVGEVEEALESGEESIRALLFEELAPSALRHRAYEWRR